MRKWILAAGLIFVTSSAWSFERGIATYQCDAWGYLEIELTNERGDSIEKSFDVGSQSDCLWFKNGFGDRARRIRDSRLIAACDTWGYITKIQIKASGSIEKVGYNDVGSQNECWDQAELINVSGGGGGAVAAYSCDTWGYLHIDLTTADGQSFEENFDVGDHNDCTYFTQRWASYKSRVWDYTLVAACDTWGYMTKIRIAAEGEIKLLERRDQGSQQECREKADIINEL